MTKYPNFIHLPLSRELIQVDDIIYVGDVKDKRSFKYGRYWSFKITWANKSTLEFKYTSMARCQADRQFIQDLLLKESPQENKMIYS